MEKQTETVVLHPSTNSHVIKGDVKVTSTLPDLGGMTLSVKDTGVVLHGEHGVICTEAENVVKLVQQEFNPVTNMLQNSFD